MVNGLGIRTKRIISVLLFLVILALSIKACVMLVEHKSSKIKYTDFFESETDYDCYLLGTSITLNSLLPMEMWENYGISAYNFGSSNCTPAEDFYIAREAMKYKKPRLVVIDMLGVVEFNEIGNGKYMYTQVEAQHTQFDCFPYSRTKAEAVNDLFDIYDDRNDFLWNFIMYHNRWSELEEQDFRWREMLNVEKGALTNTGTLGKAVFKPYLKDETISLEGVNYDYFIRLVEYCRDQGIDVLALYLPHPVEELNMRVANSIGAVADRYDNLEYINMLDMDILDPYTDFTSDNLHPNLSGALKISDYIGKYIRDNYDVSDFRDDPEWIDASAKYIEYKKENIIKQEALPYYLVQLSDDDFDGELIVYNDEIMDDEWLRRLFENAGITPLNESAKGNEECDAKITVYRAGTGEVVDTALFKYIDKKTEERTIFDLQKAEVPD
ncbi:MAG TPA: hypothetical protein DIS78_02540 [Lachnospiraceae bacterium]|nr:hypothetical protein [Lachnospiraceae bacterium]